MMIPYGLAHLMMLGCTILFYIAGCIVCRKSCRLVQNIIFIVITILCCSGIFFRYAMSLKFDFGNINWTTLFTQMLQVCNFNFILLPLMLVPRFELARQYGMFFSMFAAMTAHTSVSSSFRNLEWYNITVLNSWLNHMFAVALPMFMIAARRTKPKLNFVLPVAICVFGYFTGVAIISHFLIKGGMLIPENSFSFIYDRGQTAGFDLFYKIWPKDYFYLWLIFPFLIIYFYILAIAFKKYKVYIY